MNRGRLVIAAKKKAAGTKEKPANLRSPEVRGIARELTNLGLVHVKQEGELNVRQRENLRRALAEAGLALGWDVKAATSPDPLNAVSKDVKKLVKSGAKTLKKEVLDELSRKETEEAELVSVVESVHELVEKPEEAYPAEISYTHTSRDITQGYFTNTMTLTVNDATEAKEAVQTIEKSMNRWGKLRVQMFNDLEQTDMHLGILTGDLASFMDTSEGLLSELLLTLA